MTIKKEYLRTNSEILQGQIAGHVEQSLAPMSVFAAANQDNGSGLNAWTGPFFAITALETVTIAFSGSSLGITQGGDGNAVAEGETTDLYWNLQLPTGLTIYGTFHVVKLSNADATGRILMYHHADVIPTVAGS